MVRRVSACRGKGWGCPKRSGKFQSRPALKKIPRPRIFSARLFRSARLQLFCLRSKIASTRQEWDDSDRQEGKE